MGAGTSWKVEVLCGHTEIREVYAVTSTEAVLEVRQQPGVIDVKRVIWDGEEE